MYLINMLLFLSIFASVDVQFIFCFLYLGILDLGTSGENVKRVKTWNFLRKHATGTAPTELHTVHVERGMSWSEATEKWAELNGAKEGFYVSQQIRNGKHTAILAVAVDTGVKKKSESKKDQMYNVYRPNTGQQFRQESLAELEKKYKKVNIFRYVMYLNIFINSLKNCVFLCLRCPQMTLKKLGWVSMMHQLLHVHMPIGGGTVGT